MSAHLLSAKAGIAQGFGVIVHDCLKQIDANITGVIQSSDAEYVHQMRVGLRKLRVAIDLFSPVFPCPKALQTDIAWLAKQLGGARDWDVLAISTLPALQGKLSEGGDLVDVDISALQELAHKQALHQHRLAARAVNAKRSLHLWLALREWIDAISQKDLPLPLSSFAVEAVRHYQRQLRKRSMTMNVVDADSRHRLRITAKKMRYASEFFGQYFRKKPLRRFLGKLTRLQDTFGVANDAAIADQLLSILAVKHPESAASCQIIRNHLASSVHDNLDEFAISARRVVLLKKLKISALKKSVKKKD